MSENQENEASAPLVFPAQGEKTQVTFYTQMASELTDAHREVLDELRRALSERGWVQPIGQLLDKLAEHGDRAALSAALDDLAHRRLVNLDRGAGTVTGAFGCLATARTDHRAHLATGVDVFTFGGFDLLSLRDTLGKDLDAFTVCPETGQAIELTLAGGEIVASNLSGIAGFFATWDGRRPLADVARDSPLFASDEALEAWQAARPDLDGMALPADLLLWVGLSGAQALGAARSKLFGHG